MENCALTFSLTSGIVALYSTHIRLLLFPVLDRYGRGRDYQLYYPPLLPSRVYFFPRGSPAWILILVLASYGLSNLRGSKRHQCNLF
jgi:hypothetical protein